MPARRTHFPLVTEGQTIATDRPGVSLREINRRAFLDFLNNYKMEGIPRDWKFSPDFDVVGRGYDLYGHYAYSGSCKGKIFDWRYASGATPYGQFQVPDCVTATAQNITDIKTHSGNSALEIQTSLSRSMTVSGGLLSMFSATINAGIAEIELRKSRRSYSIVQMFCGFNRYAFDPKSAAVRKLMTSEFRLALDRYAPEDLFSAYGTHFPVEVVTGGRLDYCCSTRVFDYHSSSAISVSAKASLDVGIGKIGLGGSSDVAKMVTSFESATEDELLTYGGSPIKAAIIGGTGSQAELRARFVEWLESIPQNLTFINFGSPDCLRGIWTLCDDTSRRNQLETAATEYLKKRDGQNRIEADRIVDVVVVAGNNAGIAAPQGYEKIPYDLNKGAGGDFIYACIRKEPVNVIKYGSIRPVTDLKVVMGDSASVGAPAGYEKVPVDLNRGAGGKYIYLCKCKGQPGVPDGGLRDLTVVGGSHPNIAPPYGYRRIESDLNKGAGGLFIYFCLI
jgi:hypothetical protein